MGTYIEPRVLKGFRDLLPERARALRNACATLESAFDSFGFRPIDTPVLEYAEILLGKGGGETDKQIYRFLDHGKRDVAMRFDLTVPLARFMAQHRHDLVLPFRCYHIGKVFRGENTQRGRYREFIQCDFDILGVDSAIADFEIVLLATHTLEKLNIGAHRIHVSDRGLLIALLEKLGLSAQAVGIVRCIDKLHKIGTQLVKEQLAELLSEDYAELIMEFISVHDDNDTTASAPDNHVILQTIEDKLTGEWGRAIRYNVDNVNRNVDANTDDSPLGLAAVNRLRALLEQAKATGIDDRIRIDPSITRGLDYYTGMVFETFINHLTDIGSICSGGRYNDLSALYGASALPGVGGSVGIERLLAAFEEMGRNDTVDDGNDALVVCLEESLGAHYQRLAQHLRTAGLRCHVYPQARKLGVQFAYAEKQGIAVAVICGSEEAQRHTCNIRNIATRESHNDIDWNSAVRITRSIVEQRNAV